MMLTMHETAKEIIRITPDRCESLPDRMKHIKLFQKCHWPDLNSKILQYLSIWATTVGTVWSSRPSAVYKQEEDWDCRDMTLKAQGTVLSSRQKGQERNRAPVLWMGACAALPGHLIKISASMPVCLIFSECIPRILSFLRPLLK